MIIFSACGVNIYEDTDRQEGSYKTSEIIHKGIYGV
jgi:hypothetical protein